MDDLDKKDFAVLFYGLGEYYDKPVTKNLLLIYFDDLKRYSLDEVKEGASKHRLDPKHGTYWPKSADIIRHLQANEISIEQKAELAWAQVIREIRCTGSYGTLKLDDKQAVAAVKSLGSWSQLCSSTESDMTWKKKEFISMYETYERTPIEFLPSSLPGRIGLVEHKQDAVDAFARIEEGIAKYRLKNK